MNMDDGLQKLQKKAIVRAARVAAARLEAAGDRKAAEDVRRLIKSSISARLQARRLYRDNMRLREMISAIDPR